MLQRDEAAAARNLANQGVATGNVKWVSQALSKGVTVSLARFFQVVQRVGCREFRNGSTRWPG